jgi:hypothetical protein
MPEVRKQEAGTTGLVRPIRVDGVFDDPSVIRRLVKRNGPYQTMASYLPASAVRGRQATAGEDVPPHFRATWAAGGRPLMDGAEVAPTTTGRTGSTARCARSTLHSPGEASRRPDSCRRYLIRAGWT